MRRGRSYSPEERSQILKEVKDTSNVVVVARKHNIPRSTIHTWLQKTKHSKSTHQDTSLQQLKKQMADKDLEIRILKDLLKKTNQAWLKE